MAGFVGGAGLAYLANYKANDELQEKIHNYQDNRDKQLKLPQDDARMQSLLKDNVDIKLGPRPFCYKELNRPRVMNPLKSHYWKPRQIRKSRPQPP